MLSSDKNVETIARLIGNTRKYGEMKLETIERHTVEGLSTLLSTIIMGAVIFVVSLIVIVFLSGAIVYALAPHIGGTAIAFLAMGLVYAVILSFIYMKRHALIMIPIRKALAQGFFAEKAEEEAPSAEEMNTVKDSIIGDYQSLTAPPSPARNRFELAMNTASKAWTVADGLIMGYKLYKKFFNKRRR